MAERVGWTDGNWLRRHDFLQPRRTGKLALRHFVEIGQGDNPDQPSVVYHGKTAMVRSRNACTTSSSVIWLLKVSTFCCITSAAVSLAHRPSCRTSGSIRI